MKTKPETSRARSLLKRKKDKKASKRVPGDVRIEEATPKRTKARTQSGDLTGVSGVGFSGGECFVKLLEKGQDLEGELVLAVRQTRDADEGETPVHSGPRARVPDYKNRNRI
jgi:hypothetical protein